MKITAFKNHFFETLQDEYPKEETGSFFFILLQEFTGLTRLDLALDPQRELTEAQKQKLEQALDRLQDHEPIQYITGSTEFFGLNFKVDKNVLIPRPETEELVQWVLEESDSSVALRVLDIGTGSGCIAISLAKNLPQAKISAIDISEEALNVARENAELNQVSVEFLQKDILNTDPLPQQYDLIISNPPYVRELEKTEMQRNVLEHEPETALYVKDNDPLIFYRKITLLAAKHLNPGGKLYFEINQYLGKETEALLAEKNFQTRLKKDIFGVDRMLRGIKS
ncbi:peptide chain release factor N(5)-glutamine methyltransferase [Salinimicrobium sp. CDJ15-81-2]|nr:peptide chain release factor N(5)-glutamine methyltransferase [Salinimicrobium nanhaiense]